MGFADLPDEKVAIKIFQQSLTRDRLAHAYLISGGDPVTLEAFATMLAKTLNCETPPQRAPSGLGLDACDHCQPCRQIAAAQQADVSWVRPESKSRIITVAQIRAVMEAVHLKAHASPFKIFIVSGAERMNVQAANAFLKTLEEPPGRSVLLLLTTEPQRLLDTIVSRCLRINLSGTPSMDADPEGIAWLTGLSRQSQDAKGRIGSRYRMLGDLLARLASKKTKIEEMLTSSSPLETFDDLEPSLQDRYKQELAAAIEAEYRRQRADIVSLLQWFLRDVWLHTLKTGDRLLHFPNLARETQQIAARITQEAALENINITDQLQRQLNTNIQEALAIEVALLKIAL
ncbi:MAG: DNA polymerase III subunit tau [Verrucomicrobia subdivision 3 bacterium]|nr:DNA polymerase III subunit tau [Limisphaerales bacterium]MCS1414387.1 DNA polymerase III subunit tau [Limisphaerales bacterium]